MPRKDIRLERKPLTWLHPNPRNARRHLAGSIKAIQSSIERFGFLNPIIAQADGTIVAGEGRWRAAKKLGLAEVPVVVVEMGDAEALAYLVVDNATTDLSMWDEVEVQAIAVELARTEFDLRDVGDFDFLDGLDFDGAPWPEPQKDTVVKRLELTVKWGTGLGQVWLVGDHRIMCGDSTSASDIAILCGGQEPDIAVTDPPYDLDAETVRGVLLSVAPRCAVLTGQKQAFGLCDDSLVFGMDLCWVHGTPRSVGAAHQPVWYHNNLILAHRAGESLGWHRPTAGFGSIICDGTGGFDMAAFGQGKHDTPFREILRGFHEAKTVIDPFCGTGAVVLACEKLRLRCLAMELDPGHLGACLERLYLFGLRPQLSP